MSDVLIGTDGVPADICSVNMIQRAAFSDAVTDTLFVKYSSVYDVKSLDALTQRIKECVHWHSLNATPLSAAYLNRLYGRVASKHGTSVTALLHSLTLSGTLRTLNRYSKRMAYVSAAVWNAEVESMPTDDFEQAVNWWTGNIK